MYLFSQGIIYSETAAANYKDKEMFSKLEKRLTAKRCGSTEEVCTFGQLELFSYEWETYGMELQSWCRIEDIVFNQSQCVKSLFSQSECLGTTRNTVTAQTVP